MTENQASQALPIVICDDSSFARNAMARSLPEHWNVEINYAENGQQAIDKIEKGLAHVLFLDLNMPVMDGYETLKVIREYDLQTIVIVVSGDVQDEARNRVIEMGALDFIEKPIDIDKLMDILEKYGIYEGDRHLAETDIASVTPHSVDEQLDMFRELTNIAMGQAGKSLARVLNCFVDLPVPNIALVNSNELSMAIGDIDKNEKVSAVSKGFVSQKLRGEALILFNDTRVKSIYALLGYPMDDDSEELQLEALMDISNIIVGACLSGLSNQLQISLSHTTPSVLGMHCNLEELVNRNATKLEKVLMVEIAYSIFSVDVNFELLLLFPQRCLDQVTERLSKLSAQ